MNPARRSDRSRRRNILRFVNNNVLDKVSEKGPSEGELFIPFKEALAQDG
jgi:hypothetical protein